MNENLKKLKAFGGKVLFPCEYPNCGYGTFKADEMIHHRNSRHQETKQYNAYVETLKKDNEKEFDELGKKRAREEK